MRLPGRLTMPAQSTPWPESSRTVRSPQACSAGSAEMNAVRSPRRETAANTLLAAADIGSEGVEWDPKERSVNFDASPFGSQVVWLIADEKGKFLERSKGADPTALLNAVLEQSRLGDRSPSDMTPAAREWRSGEWRIRQHWVRPRTRAAADSPDRSKEVD